MTALARDVARRYQTAEELSLALEHFLSRSGEVVTAAHLAAVVRDRCGTKIEAARRRISSATSSRAAEPLIATPTSDLSSSLPQRPSLAPELTRRGEAWRAAPWVVAAGAVALASLAVFALRSAPASSQTASASAEPAPVGPDRGSRASTGGAGHRRRRPRGGWRSNRQRGRPRAHERRQISIALESPCALRGSSSPPTARPRCTSTSRRRRRLLAAKDVDGRATGPRSRAVDLPPVAISAPIAPAVRPRPPPTPPAPNTVSVPKNPY